MNIAQTELLKNTRKYKLMANDILKNIQDAEDCIQNAFISLEAAKDVQNPTAFVRESVRNVAFNMKRAKRQEVPFEDYMGGTHRMEGQLTARSSLRFLSTRYQMLPKKRKQAFFSYFVQQKSCKEIAKEAGRSTNTVKHNWLLAVNEIKLLKGAV